MKVKTDYAEREYVTLGKEYEVIRLLGDCAEVDLDKPDVIVIGGPCAHISGNVWEVIND